MRRATTASARTGSPTTSTATRRRCSQHIELTLIAVAIGFAIAFALALLAHRRRWLVPPITQITGILYTLPSVAVFFLLLPLTGRGKTTAIIALVSYTLLIIFRNVITGLEACPPRRATPAAAWA